MKKTKKKNSTKNNDNISVAVVVDFYFCWFLHQNITKTGEKKMEKLMQKFQFHDVEKLLII